MDRSTANLLLYTKAFCLQAEEEHRRGGPIAAMLAVMHAQDAVEFSLNALARDNRVAQQKSDTIESLRKRVNDQLKLAGKPALPLEPDVDFLTATRNKIKHSASQPSDPDAQRCLDIARRFLEAVFTDHFAVAFASFSLSDLVEDARIRRHLKDATAAAAAGRPNDAVLAAAKALNLAKPDRGIATTHEYTTILLTMGADIGKLQAVQSHLPLLIPIGDAEDNVGRTRTKPRRYTVMGIKEALSPSEVEWILNSVEELVLHFQSVGLLGAATPPTSTPEIEHIGDCIIE